MSNIKCIDVSEWQNKIDWKKVKASGIEYAILRAGFGRDISQVDFEFEENYKDAKKAGIKLGVYWFSYADSVEDAKREAKACLEVIKGKTFELPVYYDLEFSTQINYGKTVLTNIAKTFCETIKKQGYSVGVYANLNWFLNYIDYEALKKSYSIWLAQYHTKPELNCDIWQYTSEGKITGVSGNVDVNIIYNKDVINIRGDVNGDTKVNIKDVTLIQKHVAKTKKLTAKQLKKGDINKDGRVNIKDATALQKEIAKK